MESLAPEECAEVWITTAGGIQWRQRVPVSELGASSPSEAARRLQRLLHTGEPLVLEGPDGSFSVPAGQVQSLIVGPCRA